MKPASTAMKLCLVSTLFLSVYFYTQGYSEGMRAQTLQARMTALEKENEALQVTADQVQHKLASLDGVAVRHLHHPTLQELKQFLANDTTSHHPRLKGQYECMDFARDLRANAAAVGLNVSFVVTNFMIVWRGEEHRYGHAFNGVLLANGTTVWVEPQNDRIYSTPEQLIAAFYLFPVQVKIIEIVVVW